MTETAHLWVFFVLVLGTVMLPGLDMAFVLGSAPVGGRRAGLSAVAGLIAGGICHVAMGATGLAVVLRLLHRARGLAAGLSLIRFRRAGSESVPPARAPRDG